MGIFYIFRKKKTGIKDKPTPRKIEHGKQEVTLTEIEWRNKGNTLSMFGRHGEAIECYERFIELAPPQYASLVEEAKRLIISLGGRFE
ncbi:MAG TPA: tetratricopeptide repeat protein [Candidatus Bathyarchaeia archaeon]|nr:tetratricopeptide repeat protein [Candidatus Bathyarchaeia archaeon]